MFVYVCNDGPDDQSGVSALWERKRYNGAPVCVIKHGGPQGNPWTSPKNGRVSIGESFTDVAFSIMFNNQRASLSVHLWWVRNSQRPVWWYVFVVTSWCCLSYGFLWCWGSCFFAHFLTPQKLTLIYFDKKTNGSEVEEPGLLQAEGLAVALVAWNVKKNGVLWGLKPQKWRFSQPKWWLYMTLPWKIHGFDSHSSHLTMDLTMDAGVQRKPARKSAHCAPTRNLWNWDTLWLWPT